ncbi:restriction endonuclease subunit S [Bacillus mexicanus]|uniref:restriction endonuclease subunit S n=1 Tax=Bacillus mexicanus TaxID=2834415 RepID=UPI003D20EFB3
MENKRVPEVRFEGFSGEWEERKLGEVAEFNPKSKIPENFEYVDLESVVGTNLISHRMEQKETAPSRAQRLAKQGDVFYQMVRPYQKNNYLFDLPYDNYVFSTGYAQMRPYVDSYFLLNRLQEERFVSNVLDRCTGTSYPAINSNDLAQIEINVPISKEEQTDIGDFFKQLDDMIALHQQELTTLKQTKQGFLQKMFPKEGESVPEVRFPGFTGDWEQRKLKDLLESAYQGINTAGDKVEYSDSGVKVLQSKHITSGTISFDDARYLDKDRYSEYFPKYVPDVDDILFANIGTIGPSAVVTDSKEFLVAWNILKMKPSNEANSRFIQLQLQRLKSQRYFEKVTTGNATKFVNKDEILGTQIVVPEKKEQSKIGDLFAHLDHLIALHQREVDALKETKKAFLQKMFV